MASTPKNTYSIDDILNEYSVDNNTPVDSEPEEIQDNIDISVEDETPKASVSQTDEDEGEMKINQKANIFKIPKNKSIIPDEDNSEEDDDTDESLPARITKTKSENAEDFSLSKSGTDFSYRSATRIQDKPNKILKNPENNIRYVKKQIDNPKIAKKKEFFNLQNIKSEKKRLDTALSSTENNNEILKDKINFDFSEKFNKIKNDLFGKKTITEKKSQINVKSIPEVDYFSIDVAINEPAPQTEKKKKSKIGEFINDINNDFSNSVQNNLDDYNSPKDASLILDDLYDLKTNLSVKLGFQVVALIISIYFSAAASYKLPMPEFISPSNSPHAYSFAMFLISAAVLFTSFPVITSGLKNLFRKRADCDSLVAVSMSMCTIAAAISTESPELIKNGFIHIFTPVAIAGFLANTIGKHLIVNRAINNFDMIISANEKHAMIYVDDESKAEQLTKGTTGDYPILTAVKKTNFAADFLKYTYSSDISDKLCNKFIVPAVVISAVLTLLAVLACHKNIDTLNISFVTSTFALFISAFNCFGIPIIVNLPLANAAAEVEDNESIILGYQSIDDFYDTNALLLNAADLFPKHSIKLCAIKIFSDNKIDTAIVAAASLVYHAGSIFTEMFERIIDGDHSLLEKVENYSLEDSMGLCGWINNKRALFGNRQLMINHNIEGMPPKSKEKDLIGKGKMAMYLSISGNLAAMFVVKIKADPEIAENLRDITDNGTSLIIKSIDSVATVHRISKLFDIPENMIKIIPAELHDYCTIMTAPVPRTSSSVICNGKLSSVAKALANIKHIYQSVITGVVLQSVSAIIGMFIVILFMLLGITNQVTPLMLIFYHVIWTLITFIIMKVRPR